MRELDKARPRRRYDATRRAAAAAQTRERVLRAAKDAFEKRGWVGATIPAIARAARVSRQTVEATFGTKAALLQATVDFSIRGDVSPVPLRRREAFAEMEAAPTGAAMLDLHAQLVRSVSERSAAIAWAVEHAATSDRGVARLWRTMTDNRRVGVGWATETLLAKHDAPPHLGRDYVENVFWIALDWNTYRTMTRDRGFLADEFEAWLRSYYRGMLGA